MHDWIFCDWGKVITAKAAGIKEMGFHFRNLEASSGAEGCLLHESPELPQSCEDWGLSTAGRT